jgi:hypothetical protein
VAKSGRTGLDRIQTEPSESALADALVEKMSEQAWPGIFAGGKQIVRTQITDSEATFWFDDNSAIKVVGDFKIQYRRPGLGGGDDFIDVPDEDVVDVTSEEIEAGSEEPN